MLRMINWLIVLSISGLSSLLTLAGVCPAGPSQASKARPLLIRNIQVLPMTADRREVLGQHAVLIQAGRIVRVAPDTAMSVPPGTRIIDGKGGFLLPGLTDMHVHVWDKPELSAYLAAGITTIRNASGMPFHLAYATAIDTGCLAGPRLITTGPILNGQGPNTQPNHQIVSTAAEARAAVHTQHQQGYRHLKVYSNLSREAYRAIVDESQRLGMTIMGHTPEGLREPGIPHRKPFQIPFREMLQDPLVSIEHMESIVWHALHDEFDEGKARILAKEIAASRIAVTPTLIAHRNLVLVAQSRGRYLRRPGVAWLNPFISALEQPAYKQWSTTAPAERAQHDAFYSQATRIFHEEGVKLLAGTDAGIFTNIPGISLIEELKLLTDAGLGSFAALQTATRHPAEVLGMGHQLGQIKEGYLADLILVQADPSLDISSLRSLTGLVVAGKWLGPERIAQLKYQARSTSYARSKQQIMDGLKAQGSALE